MPEIVIDANVQDSVHRNLTPSTFKMSEWLFLKDVACWNSHVPMLHLQSWEVGISRRMDPIFMRLSNVKRKHMRERVSDVKFICVGYLMVRDEISMMLFV